MRKPLLLFLCVWLSLAAWAQTSHWNTRDFRLVTNYEVKCDSGCTLLYLLTLVPRSHPGFQDIQKTTFSIKPFRVFTERNTCFAEFRIKNPQQAFDLSVLTEGRLYNTDYASGRSAPSIPQDSLTVFLQSTPLCESDSPQIRNMAARIMQREKSDIGRIHDIWETVHDIPFVYGPVKSALEILNSQEGCCTGKTNLFMALCRACGIPAREYYGIASGEAHAWPETYLEGRGWVKFEPTHFNETDYKSINGWHVRLSDGRFVLLALDTNFRYRFVSKGTKATVKESFRFDVLQEE